MTKFVKKYFYITYKEHKSRSQYIRKVIIYTTKNGKIRNRLRNKTFL